MQAQFDNGSLWFDSLPGSLLPAPVETLPAHVDIAIVGEGFFKVKDQNGEELYTRDGSLKRGPTGQLTTSQGKVLDPPIQVDPKATNIVVGENGTISFMQDSNPRIQSRLN